jgi:hypothetical protein
VESLRNGTKGSEAALCHRKSEGEVEKGLANPWKRKNITKKAHAGRRQETNGKSHLAI